MVVLTDEEKAIQDEKKPVSDHNEPRLDPLNPSFISSHDAPGNIITQVVFQGNNYDEWSRSIELSLMARCKFDFIDGTILKPTDATKLTTWRCIQAMLVQWLLNTIDKSIKKGLPHFQEVKPLWDTLKRRYDIGNGPRRQQLKAALAACKQTMNMTVSEYFGQLEPLWDELSNYNPPPRCKCGLCTCDISGDFQLWIDEEHFHDFLYGINQELYGTVRSTLLAQHPPPSLDRAYRTMLQQEGLLTEHTTLADDSILHMRPCKLQGFAKTQEK